MESVYRVRDQMLEQIREFCPDISAIANQLDPF